MAKYHQSYQNLRQFCEKWQWIDPRSGQQVTGYVHPQTARNVKRKSFDVSLFFKNHRHDQGQCSRR